MLEVPDLKSRLLAPSLYFFLQWFPRDADKCLWYFYASLNITMFSIFGGFSLIYHTNFQDRHQWIFLQSPRSMKIIFKSLSQRCRYYFLIWGINFLLWIDNTHKRYPSLYINNNFSLKVLSLVQLVSNINRKFCRYKGPINNNVIPRHPVFQSNLSDFIYFQFFWYVQFW